MPVLNFLTFTRLYACAIVGASTIANRPLQDFQAKVGGGRLFDMGGSTVKYGIACCTSRHSAIIAIIAILAAVSIKTISHGCYLKVRSCNY